MNQLSKSMTSTVCSIMRHPFPTTAFFTTPLTCILVLITVYGKAQQTKNKIYPDQMPVIPVGLDAYRMWDQLPSQKIGDRAYMRSTYDRQGGNQSADASHFLFSDGENRNVTLDVKGKGVLYFFRSNHWHGSPWHFTIDGQDQLVKETGTQDPVHARELFPVTEFIPAQPFPQPLAWTWSATKGADLIWTPMPFRQSLQIAYSRTHYGTGYYIYHLYANEDRLSQPLKSWSLASVPDNDVVQLINRSGTDIARQDGKEIKNIQRLDKPRILLAQINQAPSVIRAFKLRLPMDSALALERLRLLVTWDDASHPSIDAPLCLFFGAGTFYNRNQREYLVKGFPINIKYDYNQKQVELACYYPMPFFKNAKFELAGITPGNTGIGCDIRYAPYSTPARISSYFHASYKDIPYPEPGKDMTYLDTKGMEGQEDWTGSFAGMSFIFSHQANLGTLEGDPRFFFDDSQTPQAYGTGTEEWAGGGDYWGGENMTLPFAGHPCGAKNKNESKHEKDLIESAYRFLIADNMPFGKRAVIRMEHGGEDLSTEHYEAVCYWYGLPGHTLSKTDSIDIGNLSSEQAHRYYSPTASPVQKIVSRYEWGIDRFPARLWGLDPARMKGYDSVAGKEIFPAQAEEGRYTRGISEFTAKISPHNTGVLLRRTLDYSFPNQTAMVFVADAGDAGQKKSAWKLAGTWYLAGSNTAVYSDPPGELENRLLVTQTSNRRLRDDEFLLPARLTAGRPAIRIRIQFVPNGQQLFPDFPFPKKSAWSELRYAVYSYTVPEFRMP